MQTHATILLASILMLTGCGTGTTPDTTEQARHESAEQDAPADRSLANTQWSLIEVEGQPAVTIDAPRDAHLVFDAGSQRVSGSGGVNLLNGMYTRNGHELTFGPIASTLMAGPEPLMKQEQAMNRALSATRSFTIEGDVLTLLNESGEPLARFKGAALEKSNG